MIATEDFSKQIRIKIIETAYFAGSKSAHVGGALSLADILAVLYSKGFIRYNEDPSWDERGRFILSKGHACLAYYSVLRVLNYINDEDLQKFETDGAILLGHPILNKKKGIEFSTGSLGMGLSIGIGQAIAAQKKNKNYKVFVVLGDGETNEGSVWEAAMSAPKFNLKNLTVIIDNNKFQQTGSTDEIMRNDNLSLKFKSFGWEVFEIDGHNYDEIEKVLKYETTSPKAIVANTIKGKGFSFSENNNNWHHSVLSKSIYEEALNEINK